MIDTKAGVLSRLVLNNQQYKAVVYESGPQLIFAGAGTGKTRVLTAKIAHLIDRGISPGRLFAATFTNKAAREMRERVERFVNRSIAGMWIGTFHSLCVRILRSECGHIGYQSSFSIYDTSDQTTLIRKVLQQLEIDDRSGSPRQILSRISHFKNRCLSVDEVRKQAVGFYEQELLRIYATYQKLLVDHQAMDFDDLLMRTVTLLRDNKEVADRYAALFDYVLVDEYQDTNIAQLQLIKALSRHHHRIFAVGDDDQSIYGWRGAQIDNILQFEQHFPNTKTFKLEQNYRSTGAILEFANAAIVPNNMRAAKELWTEQEKGFRVVVSRFRDDRHEATKVTEAIAKLCKSKLNGSAIAVLFRTNAQSRAFEEAFRKRNLPYVLVGGTGFYERMEIKDCLAYLRLLVNPYDDVGFERIYNVPARGLGEKAFEALSSYASDQHQSLLEALIECDPTMLGNRFKKGFSELKELFVCLRDTVKKGVTPFEILSETVQLLGYMDVLSVQASEEAAGRIENINELLNVLSIWSKENPEKDLSAFLEEVSLVSDVDTWEQKENAVNLMTMHCAKGLEFKQVFLVGLEEGLLPSRQNFDDEVKIEEERRLLYVGATRAGERLYCSYVDRRYRFGELLPQAPSRFIEAIDTSIYEFDDQTRDFGTFSLPGATVAKTPAKPTQRITRPDIPTKKDTWNQDFGYDDFSQEVVEYRMGQHVRHKKYGRGRILSISGFGSDMKVTVLFNDGIRRKLMAKFANFERD